MMTSRFLTELQVLEISEGAETPRYELAAPFAVQSGVLQATVVVPAGFRYDGESIPTWLRGLVPPFGQSKRAACVHDYLYAWGGYNRAPGVLVPVTREQADLVYHELALLKGLPGWRASMRFTVLRLVGWAAWRAHRRREVPD